MTNKHIGSNSDDSASEEGLTTPKSSWNYRVIEFTHESGEIYRVIHEVFYANDVPTAYSHAAVAWEVEEGNESPIRQLDRMREALAKPVLKATDFGPVEKDPPDDN